MCQIINLKQHNSTTRQKVNILKTQKYMGLYDCIYADCPKCGNELKFQSKSGDCLLNNYDLKNSPEDVLADANRHAPIKCKCGSLVSIDTTKRTAVLVFNPQPNP